jgi:hypothetical protein
MYVKREWTIGGVKLTSVWEIMAIFALMSTAITVAVLWFVHSSAKIRSRNEIQKKKIDVIDRHFDDMIRIECPYCKTIYSPNHLQCPNCKASTKEILFPEMPE